MLAYLPMAWVGEHIFSYAQAWCAGFCVSCPEPGDTVMTDLREIGPDLLLRAAAGFREHPDPGDDPHGGRGLGQARAVPLFPRRGAAGAAPAILDGRPVPLARPDAVRGSANCWSTARCRNVLGLSRIRVAYTAGEAIGPDLFRFYRSLGINLKQLYGMTESSVFLCISRTGRCKPDTVGGPIPGSNCDRRERRGAVQVARARSGLLQEPGGTAEAKMPTAGCVPATPGFFDAGRAAQDHRPRQGCRPARRTARCLRRNIIENKLKFYPYIKEAVAFGDGRDFVCAFINIDLGAVGDWAERRGLAYGSYQELAGRRRGLRAGRRAASSR